MIKFTTIRWRNFLSTGDKFTEVQLDVEHSTLIVGQNGAGKSTLLDALAFGLFGKPHRDIKKAQLVNSINGKKAEVQVEFSIGRQEFKIVRGVRPNIFEIWQNGNMINQDSNARDYQKFLEQNILKLNHKSFHQIVVLGSSSFIPFMQLPTTHRREVIEDLLDINVFSKMNGLLRERIARVRDNLKDTEYQLDLIKDKISIQHKYISDVKELNDDIVQDKSEKIDYLQTEINSLQNKNQEFSNQIEGQSWVQETLNKAHDKKQTLLQYKAQFEAQIKSLVKEAKFYNENETCPTCSQDIDQKLKQTKVKSTRVRAEELQKAMDDAAAKSAAVESDIKQFNDIVSQIAEWNTHIHSNNTTISRSQREITVLSNEITDIKGKGGDVAQAVATLENLEHDRTINTERKLSLMDQRTYNEAISEMLKDTGIKTKVIKQYLPVMNKFVNQYLQVMDFFVSFNLDESFNEIIKSRHRDEFKYASFSEGEKQRIDLSLMFTWRQIARMKNSTSTNLLILDETFDSSLDNDGIDNLMKILYTLDDLTSVFIISHKGEVLENKFRNKIEFIKERNFSRIK
ncbi:MAG: hypothetical protein CBB72_016370 [Muricauda sp. TMED12]|nr:MAG: hypothetical protein CBB72_016370 [Muricauda sp. TMED12]